MSFNFATSSITPVMPPDVLSGASGNLAASGLSQEQKIKAVSKAMEGMFAGQLMSELGKGLGGKSEAQEGGLYQDFIQQAMAQQVTSGGGFGLAKFLEDSLTPAKHIAAGTPFHPSFSHGTGTH